MGGGDVSHLCALHFVPAAVQDDFSPLDDDAVGERLAPTERRRSRVRGGAAEQPPAAAAGVAAVLPPLLRTRRAVDRERERCTDARKEEGRSALEQIVCADQFSRRYGRAPAEFQSLQTALAELTESSHGVCLLEWWERRAARASGVLQNLAASLQAGLTAADAAGTLVDRIRRLTRVQSALQYWDGAVGGLVVLVRRGIPLSPDRLRAFGEAHLMADDEAHRRVASFAADAANLLAAGASMSFLHSREVEREEQLLTDARQRRGALAEEPRRDKRVRDGPSDRDCDRVDRAGRERDRAAARAEQRKQSFRGGRGGPSDNTGRGGGGRGGGGGDHLPSLESNMCSRCLSTEHLVEHCKNMMRCRHCKEEGHKFKNCPSK